MTDVRADDPEQWLDLALDPKAAAADLVWIAAVTDEVAIMRAVVDNPNAPDGTIEILLKRVIDSATNSDAGAPVTEWVEALTNPRALTALSRCDIAEVNPAVARNPATPTDVLRDLYRRRKSMAIPAAIARNHRAPADLLARIARNSPGWRAKASVAANPMTGKKTRLRCLADDNEFVRGSLAQSAAVTTDELDTLAGDPSISVRAAVAANRKVGRRAAGALADDQNPAVRARLLSNPAVPAEIRRTIAAQGLAE